MKVFHDGPDMLRPAGNANFDNPFDLSFPTGRGLSALANTSLCHSRAAFTAATVDTRPRHR